MIFTAIVIALCSSAFYLIGAIVGRTRALDSMRAWCRAQEEATGDEAYKWCAIEIESRLYGDPS